MQESNVISLSPLTFPPSWTVSLQLSRVAIVEMQSKVQKALSDLLCLQEAVETKLTINKALLRSKVKQPESIKTVLDDLGKMPAPNDKAQVRWLDTAFTLTDKAYRSSNKCFETTIQLINLSHISHIVHLNKDYLMSVCKAKSEVQLLNNHFLSLLKLLPEEAKQDNGENVISLQSSQPINAPQNQNRSSVSRKKPRVNPKTEKSYSNTRFSTNVQECYRIGLQKMIEELRKLGNKDPNYLEGLGYQAQLIENIDSVERSGSTDSFKADRARILRQLNELCLKTLDKSFNEICQI